MMNDGNAYTAQEMADHIGVTRRNIYQICDALIDIGIPVAHDGKYYRIDTKAYPVRLLATHNGFTIDDIRHIYTMMLKDPTINPQTVEVIKRIEENYGLQRIEFLERKVDVLSNYEAIKTAIAQKRICIFHNYSSVHGKTVRNRIVEPFQILETNQDVRAYEIHDHCNKTFRLSRIDHVELGDAFWNNESKHELLKTDAFAYSSDQLHHIALKLGFQSCVFLKEEYPHCTQWLKQMTEDQWLLDMDVYDYQVMARFVLGLSWDIDVLGDDGFLQYLDEQIVQLQRHARNWSGREG